ncbi:hypothetical protein RB195_003750 [Necator americanus]|uniref:Protein kinase domain-containing protein n=1 Tax=Necator americanus TaxID=51031 RepID=A0ABR1DQ08_NECAM
MLPARTQLPNAIPEDSEESGDDELPPMRAPPTRALRRLSASIPVRKHSPFITGRASTSAENGLDEAESSWRGKEREQSFRSMEKHLEPLDEESNVSPTRSRTTSNSTHEFSSPKLPDTVVANMIKLSVLSEGRSRFGVVSKFINKATMANYAVVEWKISAMDEKSRKEVISQLEFYSTLRHRRIGSLYGYHVNDERLLIFRTFLPTGAVADQLKVGPLPESVAERYFRQLLEALEFLHDRNVIHGDIKTSNLLVTLSGDIQVTDISLPHAPKPDKHKRRTLLHCAPEMFETRDSWDNITAAADIWAAGCVLVTMVTRYAPFQDLFLSFSTQDLHEKLLECNRKGSPSRLSYTSRTLIPTSSKELADMVDATFVWDPENRPKAAQLLERFFPSGKSRKTSRMSQSSSGVRKSIKRGTAEHQDLYNDGPTVLPTDDAQKTLLERLYKSAERQADVEEKPLLFCMKWFGSRILIFLLLLLKWVAMVLLAALSLGFVTGSVFLAVYVIYSGIGVVCQCQLNEGFIVLIALILLPIIILLTTLCVNNSCEKYKQAQEDGSLEKCRYVYPRPEDDIILCGIIVVDGKKEERKFSVRRKLAGVENDPTAAANLPKGAFVRGVAGIA